MQEIVDKEIDDLLETGVIERSEAPYASPLVLVKKPDNTYRVCVNFKELNKIHFQGWLAVKFTPRLISVREIMGSHARGVKRLQDICMLKGSDEIQSYAFWHGKLRLHI